MQARQGGEETFAKATDDDLMPSGITRADSDKEQLFCGCNKTNGCVVHDKKSSGRNVLHAC